MTIIIIFIIILLSWIDIFIWLLFSLLFSFLLLFLLLFFLKNNNNLVNSDITLSSFPFIETKTTSTNNN